MTFWNYHGVGFILAILGAGNDRQGVNEMDGELVIAPFSSCCLCKGPGERFRMNTNYITLIPGTLVVDPVDDERNYTTACGMCQPVIVEHWGDMWAEYYSGRL